MDLCHVLECNKKIKQERKEGGFKSPPVLQ